LIVSDLFNINVSCAERRKRRFQPQKPDYLLLAHAPRKRGEYRTDKEIRVFY